MTGSKPTKTVPTPKQPSRRTNDSLFGDADAPGHGRSKGSPPATAPSWGGGGAAPKEPRLWICRLAVVEELPQSGETIREIEFRRGLNIIATDEATDADTRPIGHSVGKTLLIRLIRYCLGDPSFCTRGTRTAITEQWEHGYVLAHFRIDGEDWTVARPIGLDAGSTSSFSAHSSSLDAVRSEGAKRQAYSVFVDRLDALVTKTFADFELPHLDRQDRRALWTDYLGWLIRDQHCRYRHAAEWRDSDLDAGVATLHKDDAALVIQMALGLFDAGRKKLATAHQRLLVQRSRIERERSDTEAFLARAGAFVADADTDVSIPLLAASLMSRAEQDIERLRLLQADLDDPAEVTKAQAEAREAVEARVKSEAIVESLTVTLQTTEAQLRQLETASTEQAYRMFAMMGSQYCPIFATRQAADSGGCPGRSTPLTVGMKDPQHLLKISETDQTVQRLRGELADATTAVAAWRDDESKALAKVSTAQQKYNGTLRGVAESIGRAEERKRQATALRATWDGLERVGGRIAALDRQITESLEQQQTLRASLERRQKALSTRFDTILKRLLGSDAGGKIVIDGRGIRPEVGAGVAVGGEAMSTSATVLGFDLACLLEQGTEPSCTLGFLCHDSPREADMESSIYNRLFRSVRDDEPRSHKAEASFQYIVTTTSPPPNDIRLPFVVLTLSARRQDQLLLRRRF